MIADARNCKVYLRIGLEFTTLETVGRIRILGIGNTIP
jgi:hypothetical protein